MSSISVSAEREIAAPAERVYRILADYQHHHPRILPDAFSDFSVEQRGVGAGTIIRFQVTVGGRTESYHSGSRSRNLDGCCAKSISMEQGHDLYCDA